EKAVRLAVELGRFGDAAQHLELLRAGAPDQADVQEGLAWAYLGARNYARAAGAFADAIKQSPDHIANYQQLAELCNKRLDDPERAEQVLDELVAANPRAPAAWLARARWSEAHGAAGSAADDVARAVELEPRDPSVYLAAVELARRRGRPQEA